MMFRKFSFGKQRHLMHMVNGYERIPQLSQTSDVAFSNPLEKRKQVSSGNEP